MTWKAALLVRRVFYPALGWGSIITRIKLNYVWLMLFVRVMFDPTYLKILSFLPPHLTRLIFCALQTIRWCSPLFELLCIFCAFTLWCPDCDGHEVCYSHSASSSSESVCIGGPSMMASAIYEAVCPGSCQPAWQASRLAMVTWPAENPNKLLWPFCPLWPPPVCTRACSTIWRPPLLATNSIWAVAGNATCSGQWSGQVGWPDLSGQAGLASCQ